MHMLATELGSACRKARMVSGWTQEQTAARLNLGNEVYARMERGGAIPSLATAMKLRRVLGISLDALASMALLDA